MNERKRDFGLVARDGISDSWALAEMLARRVVREPDKLVLCKWGGRNVSTERFGRRLETPRRRLASGGASALASG